MRIIAVLLIFIGFNLPLTAQQVKSIVGIKTYLYKDSTYPPQIINPAYEYKFDTKGRLVLNRDVEGICAGEYKFDSLDRKINENWYCGEGHSEKTITYSKNVKITTEGTGMSEAVLLDSLNEKGKPYLSIEKTIHYENYGLSNPDTIQVKRYYEYDAFGNEISRKEFSDSGTLISKKVKMYNEGGKIILSKEYDSKHQIIDSTLYQYDEKNSINGIIRYKGDSYTDYNGFDLYNHVVFSYPIVANDKKLILFADSIIHKIDLFPYWNYDIARPSLISEMSISGKSFHNDPYYDEDVAYDYNYKYGRLVSLTIQGIRSGGYSVYNHAEIFYDKKEITVKWYAKNDKGNVYNTQTDYYKNYLLQKIEEFGNDGVLSSTMAYTYTFY